MCYFKLSPSGLCEHLSALGLLLLSASIGSCWEFCLLWWGGDIMVLVYLGFEASPSFLWSHPGFRAPLAAASRPSSQPCHASGAAPWSKLLWVL